MDFGIPADYKLIFYYKKNKQIPGSCQRVEKAMEPEGYGDTNFNW